jgi:hypothetical protein
MYLGKYQNCVGQNELGIKFNACIFKALLSSAGKYPWHAYVSQVGFLNFRTEEMTVRSVSV